MINIQGVAFNAITELLQEKTYKLPYHNVNN